MNDSLVIKRLKVKTDNKQNIQQEEFEYDIKNKEGKIFHIKIKREIIRKPSLKNK